jgi:hypothetical protein
LIEGVLYINLHQGYIKDAIFEDSILKIPFVKYFKDIGVTRKPIGEIKSGTLLAGLFGTFCSEEILSSLWLGQCF